MLVAVVDAVVDAVDVSIVASVVPLPSFVGASPSIEFLRFAVRMDPVEALLKCAFLASLMSPPTLREDTYSLCICEGVRV